MTTFFSRLGVLPAVLLRKDQLPAPVGGSIRIFPVKRIRHLNASPVLGQISVMDRFGLVQVILKRGPADDMTIQEQKRGERLVLRRGADFLFHGKMREESIDLRLGHFVRMPYFMKEDEPFHPVAIGLFRTAAVMACAERLAKSIEQLWRPGGICGFLFRDAEF